METLKRTERGWAGHFILGHRCKYHRNTLLEYGRKKYIISTVGILQGLSGEIETIGYERYYETMAFEAKKEGVYWEVNVSKQLDFESEWSLDEAETESDLKADQMHEKVVEELSNRLLKIKTPLI